VQVIGTWQTVDHNSARTPLHIACKGRTELGTSRSRLKGHAFRIGFLPMLPRLISCALL
jgi:hypothetical protein